jgi:hypothetical protein
MARPIPPKTATGSERLEVGTRRLDQAPFSTLTYVHSESAGAFADWRRLKLRRADVADRGLTNERNASRFGSNRGSQESALLALSSIVLGGARC